MSFVHREWLPEHMPDQPWLHQAAQKILGERELTVENMFNHLIEVEVGDRWSGLNNPKPYHERNNKDWWTIDCAGLFYKGTNQYLTHEGWVLGTTCCYVRVELGWREYVAAETPFLAMVRGIVFVDLALKHRNDDRVERFQSFVERSLSAMREPVQC